MSIFEDVKQAVSIKDAARCYGLTVKKGIALCPFHNELTGSMKLYSDHFHCFGCHEHGDVIKLTGHLLKLSPKHRHPMKPKTTHTDSYAAIVIIWNTILRHTLHIIHRSRYIHCFWRL